LIYSSCFTAEIFLGRIPKETSMKDVSKNAQVLVTRVSPSYWKVSINNPPLNLMEPNIVVQFRDVMGAIESDENLRVVVFESAVDGFFLNHSDFNVNLDELTELPQGPTGLEAWPDVLERLPRAPVVSIAKIRGRATGNGSELSLACDMTFASREKTVLSQWEVGVGFVPGGGPMARLPRLIGRSRALEVLLGSDDINGELAEAYGYVNRALPDADLDAFVDALATRISSFDKWAISNVKRLVNAASLAPDVELAAGWSAFLASVTRPAPQVRLKKFRELGWHKPGDAETHMGAYLERVNR
jgi:enoyl-CoA hydratase/carnithine racemase